MVLGVSVLLSQLISNVPLVARYLPVLQTHAAAPETLLALAAGNPIVGNLLILCAASNVIIVQLPNTMVGLVWCQPEFIFHCLQIVTYMSFQG